MTFVVTQVQCYGIEAEEPLNKRYRQFMYLTITAANTDTALDLGSYIAGSLGTFWTAADDTATGAGALQALQDIGTRAQAFDTLGGNFMSRAQVDSSAVSMVMINSSASTGGSASETLTLTGAATGDTVVSAYTVAGPTGSVVLQRAPSSIATSGVFPVVFTGDPGGTAVIRVQLARPATTTPVAGTYTIAYANNTPNILFASGDAPTAYTVTLVWHLMPNVGPVEYYKTA